MQKVVGLRTQEQSKFVNFINFVQSKAEEQSKIFFLDCVEGNDVEVGEMQVVTLSGWLVPFDIADKFEFVWKNFNENDDWVDYFCFVEWSFTNNDEVEIRFDFY